MYLTEPKELTEEEAKELRDKITEQCNEYIRKFHEVAEFMNSDKYDGSKMVFKVEVGEWHPFEGRN